MNKQESLGGDSIKSNKIKKISFLKNQNSNITLNSDNLNSLQDQEPHQIY